MKMKMEEIAKAESSNFIKVTNSLHEEIPEENEAYNKLFKSLLCHNNYYQYLRAFILKRGWTLDHAAGELTAYYFEAPDGISPYWYMDSLEDALHKFPTKYVESMEDISELFYAIDDEENWKC